MRQSNAIDLISNERYRQIHVLGWDHAHDAEHSHGELFAAARCYLNESTAGWPWVESPDFSKGRTRNLTKAAALIAAEIDRLNNPWVQPGEDA